MPVPASPALTLKLGNFTWVLHLSWQILCYLNCLSSSSKTLLRPDLCIAYELQSYDKSTGFSFSLGALFGVYFFFLRIMLGVHKYKEGKKPLSQSPTVVVSFLVLFSGFLNNVLPHLSYIRRS